MNLKKKTELSCDRTPPQRTLPPEKCGLGPDADKMEGGLTTG